MTDKTERAAVARADPKAAGPVVTPFAADQISTPPTSEPFIDTLLVDVIVGPWRGSILHLPNADAMQAITDKWAVNHEEKPFDAAAPMPPSMTDAELTAALAAANAYVEAHNTPPEPPPPPPPEGGVTRGGEQHTRPARDMHAGRGGTYETKSEIREKDERK